MFSQNYSSLLQDTILALPASKVIIYERDVCLAEEIEKACYNIGGPSSSSSSQEQQKSSNIVAILGLLHVNGVAKQLLDKGAISIQSQD